MSAFSNYLEGRIVEHFLRANNVASPTTVYLALFTSDPAEDGSGAEAAFTNYVRKAAAWTALDASGQTKNTSSIAFDPNGNSSASAVITHAAIFDAVTAGNMLIYGPLASSKTLQVGDVLSFAANALTITID